MAIYRRNHRRPDGTTVRAKRWTITYTDEHGRRRQVPGYTDRRATEAKLAHIVRTVERAKAGIIPPTPIDAPSFQQAVHLFIQELKRTGRTPAHIAYTISRLNTVADYCHFNQLNQVTAAALTQFLNAHQDSKKPRSHHLPA